jgi:hypothetical protein
VVSLESELEDLEKKKFNSMRMAKNESHKSTIDSQFTTKITDLEFKLKEFKQKDKQQARMLQ